MKGETTMVEWYVVVLISIVAFLIGVYGFSIKLTIRLLKNGYTKEQIRHMLRK